MHFCNSRWCTRECALISSALTLRRTCWGGFEPSVSLLPWRQMALWTGTQDWHGPMTTNIATAAVLEFLCPFRRCSSYQDFTKIGGSIESVDLTKPTSDGEGASLKHRHISRTLSEPSHLTGGRMGTTHSELRGRRTTRQRNSRLCEQHMSVVYVKNKKDYSSVLSSIRTPSPTDFTRRRACGPELDDILPGHNTPSTQAEMMGHASLAPRGQLGSRPHTPVGRVDIRPHEDSVTGPQTLYYTPASPKLEYSGAPSTPGTERWHNPSKVREAGKKWKIGKQTGTQAGR